MYLSVLYRQPHTRWILSVWNYLMLLAMVRVNAEEASCWDDFYYLTGMLILNDFYQFLHKRIKHWKKRKVEGISWILIPLEVSPETIFSKIIKIYASQIMYDFVFLFIYFFIIIIMFYFFITNLFFFLWRKLN